MNVIAGSAPVENLSIPVGICPRNRPLATADLPTDKRLRAMHKGATVIRQPANKLSTAKQPQQNRPNCRELLH
jgi:hypothetical protein